MVTSSTSLGNQKNMRGILAELSIEEEVPDVNLDDAEEEGSVLKVKNEEISVEYVLDSGSPKLLLFAGLLRSRAPQ